MTETPTIVLAAGGTAGHVYPAIALADALKAHGVDVVFAGTSAGTELKIVPRYGYPLTLLPARPFERQSLAGKARAIAAAVHGWLDARAFLRDVGAAAVVGFGGYASVAPLLAARSLHIWTAIHEANWELGRANRLLASHVDCIFTAFDGITARRHRVVGMPVRRGIVELRRSAAPFGPLSVLVMTGTEPSEFMATRVPELLAGIARRGMPLRVIHQTGNAGVDAAAFRYRQLGIRATVAPFFNQIERVYSSVDFVITRAGASSVSEIAVCGLPALLIPHPCAAADHQTGNARMFQRIGGIHWIRERDWNQERVVEWLLPLLKRKDDFLAASNAIRRLGMPQAAETMAAALLEAIRFPKKPSEREAAGEDARRHRSSV